LTNSPAKKEEVKEEEAEPFLKSVPKASSQNPVKSMYASLQKTAGDL